MLVTKKSVESALSENWVKFTSTWTGQDSLSVYSSKLIADAHWAMTMFVL